MANGRQRRVAAAKRLREMQGRINREELMRKSLTGPMSEGGFSWNSPQAESLIQQQSSFGAPGRAVMNMSISDSASEQQKLLNAQNRDFNDRDIATATQDALGDRGSIDGLANLVSNDANDLDKVQLTTKDGISVNLENQRGKNNEGQEVKPTKGTFGNINPTNLPEPEPELPEAITSFIGGSTSEKIRVPMTNSAGTTVVATSPAEVNMYKKNGYREPNSTMYNPITGEGYWSDDFPNDDLINYQNAYDAL